MENFLKQNDLTVEDLVLKYKKEIIKNGSLIIKEGQGFEICGVRNSRDKKWFINLLIDGNCSNQSVNYGHYHIAKGSY